MNEYKITESVSGEIAIVKAPNPQLALIKYLRKNFVYNMQCEEWSFDFTVEVVKS
jgi:hypothetical protein